MIRVLVVEDSPVIRELLIHILASDGDMLVCGTAVNGLQAVDAVRSIRPDIVTMDIHMPKMDGLMATRLIMETCPTPIVIVSGSSSPYAEKAFRALGAGALAVVGRPSGMGSPSYKEQAAELVRTVRLMSEVRVVKRWMRGRGISAGDARPAMSAAAPPEPRVVAVGASTGGPVAIQKLLSGLGKDFPLPVLIVQHMADGFIEGFVEWLNQTSAIPVRVAADGDAMLSGYAYVAPAGSNMGVDAAERIRLAGADEVSGACPSVSHMFRSVAAAFGGHAVAVLLTGMGKDGARELKELRDKGAVTIAQDMESSVIFGMPGEAVRLGAAVYVLGLAFIAPMLSSLAARKRQTV